MRHAMESMELVTCPRVERRGRDVGMRLVRGQLGGNYSELGRAVI